MIEGRGPRSTALGLALVIAVSSFAAPAGAIDPQAKSRQLFKEAEAFANEGSFDKACPLYQAAHELNSTGGTALRAADCYEKIGKYDRALEMYRYIVAHGASDKVPERVKLAEGRVAALEKQLAPPPPTATAIVPPPPTATQAPPPPPSRVPAYVAFGVGGAGIVVGAITGVLALSDASALKKKCPNDACPAGVDWKGEKSAAMTKGWISTVGFGVGAAGVVAGIVLLVVTSPKTQAKMGTALGPDGLTLHF